MEVRRLKAYRLGDADIVSLLRGLSYDCFFLPVGRNIPDDVKVAGVNHSFDCRCFIMLLEHPTFPEVQPGERVPEADEWLDVEQVCFCKQPDGSYRRAGDWTPQPGSSPLQDVMRLLERNKNVLSIPRKLLTEPGASGSEVHGAATDAAGEPVTINDAAQSWRDKAPLL